MTLKEAKKRLQCQATGMYKAMKDTDEARGYIGKEISALDIAIDCINKQIPKKIKEIHTDEYYCPACGSENCCNDGIATDEYCPRCGQKLEVGEQL